MDRPSPLIVNCPHCGARNFAIDTDCAECGRRLTIYIGPKPKVRRVSYGSVMMVIAAVAVCLAPVRAAPGLCILLAALLMPATARSVLHIEGRKADGRPMNVREKFEAYASSTAITTAILLVATGAFVATCAPTGCASSGASKGPRNEPLRHPRRLYGRRGLRALRHLPTGPATLASQGLTP
jgi:hypothetical protein